MTSPAVPQGINEGLAKLREPFPPEAVGKLFKAFQKQPPNGPRANCSICGSYHSTAAGIHLDYVGHAAVYKRLLLVDPEWSWKPMGRAPDGTPAMTLSGDLVPMRLWIELTVLGVTRIGVGSVDSGAFDAEKQLVGDAVRNAAKAFGVALDLWSKDELESAVGEVEPPAAKASKPPKDTRPAAVKAVEKGMLQHDALADTETAKKARAAMASELLDREGSQEPAGSTQAPGKPRSVLGIPVQCTWAQARTVAIGDMAAKFGRYPPVPDLAQRTWEWASQGSSGGQREQWLEDLTNRAREHVKKGNQLLWDHQRAVLAYQAMTDRFATAPVSAEEV